MSNEFQSGFSLKNQQKNREQFNNLFLKQKNSYPFDKDTYLF